MIETRNAEAAGAVAQIDLEAYRIERGLSYRELAELIGASTPSRARAWALGLERPRDDQELEIERVTGGRVGIWAMREKRLAHRREAAERAAESVGGTPPDRSRDEAA